MKELFKGSAALDAGVLASAQAIEHYENLPVWNAEGAAWSERSRGHRLYYLRTPRTIEDRNLTNALDS
jgi:hypothetical protein